MEASDEDGYLVLKNLNAGEKNSLTIKSGDAAVVLGFDLDPLPRSVSYAGDIKTSSPGRQQGQNNPQGTALLGGDEDLTSGDINRGLAAITARIERLLGSLDVEVPVVVEVPVTVEVHTGTGSPKVFAITDPDIRFPISGFGITVTNPSAGELDSEVQLLDADRQSVFLIGSAGLSAKILNVYYEDMTAQSAALDPLNNFSAWGTPDGKSILGNTVQSMDKHPQTAITSVNGNILEVSGATFETLDVQPGDTVLIENATNNVPFNHNGEFVVDQVLSEEMVSVRAKSSYESLISGSDKPTILNDSLPGGTVYGDMTVLIGDYLPGTALAFQVNGDTPTGSYIARIMTGKKIRDLAPGDVGRNTLPNQDASASALREHIPLASSGYRHNAIDVDAPAVVGSPDSLTLGTVESQLAELLYHINHLIAGQVTYAGGPDWADGTVNSGAGYPKPMEDQMDKNIGELAGKSAGNDGAAKIGTEAKGDLAQDTIRGQLDELDTDWVKRSGRTNTVNGPATETDAFLDTTTEPVNYKLLWQMKMKASYSTTAKTRLYASTNGFCITTNAEASQATPGAFTRDDVTVFATKLELGPYGLHLSTAEASLWTVWDDFAYFEVDPGSSTPQKLGLLGGIEFGNTPTHDSDDNPILSRLVAPAGDRKTLLRCSSVDGEGPHVLWNEADKGLDITARAAWDAGTSQWDPSGTLWPSLLRIKPDELSLRLRESTSSAQFADSSWVTILRILNNAGVSEVEAAKILRALEDVYLKKTTTLGESLVGDEAGSHTPRLSSSFSSNASIGDRVLMWEMPNPISDGTPVRIYRYSKYGYNDALEIAVNCLWDNGAGQWTQDVQVSGRESSRFRFNSDSVVLSSKEALEASAWLDTGWDYETWLKLYDQSYSLNQWNVITNRNQVRAWVLLETNGTGADVGFTVLNGWNVNTFSDPDATTVRVFVSQDFADDEYVVMAQMYEIGSGNAYEAHAVHGSLTAGYCDIKATINGSANNFQTLGQVRHLAVFFLGVQS